MKKTLVFVSSEPKVVASATTVLNHFEIPFEQEILGSGYIAPNSKYHLYVSSEQAEKAAEVLQKFPSEALHPRSESHPSMFDIWFGRIQLAVIIGFVILAIVLNLRGYFK